MRKSTPELCPAIGFRGKLEQETREVKIVICGKDSLEALHTMVVAAYTMYYVPALTVKRTNHTDAMPGH